MDVFTQVVTNVGFPIAVTAFLLIRIEKKLDSLNETLIDLINSITKK